MAETAKVRLVRCPKCENLLPELPDFSLYQCGGCGAVLRGKAKGIQEDGSSVVSGELKGVGVSGENMVVNPPESGTDSANVIGKGRVERIQEEEMTSNVIPTSRAANREFQPDSDARRRGKESVRRPQEHFEDAYSSYANGHGRHINQGKDYDVDLDRPEYVHQRRENAVNGSAVSYGSGRGVNAYAQGIRHDNPRYQEEGPSSYGTNPYYRHGERTSYPSNNLNGMDSIENLENGRAELLRKLDDLKNQLTQSCEISDRPERVGNGRRMVSPAPPDPYGRHHAVAYLPERPHDMGDSYLNRAPGYVPYTDSRYGTRGPDPYPQRGYPNEFLGYVDPYHPDMLQRPPQPHHSRYMHRPHHEHYPGYYGDVNHDHFMLHQHENLFHQPACSCVHCSNKNWNLPPTMDPHERRSQNLPPNRNLRHSPNPILHGPESYSSGGSNYPLRSRPSQQTHNSSELEWEKDGFSNHRPRKVAVAHKNGRVWCPVAGGAPIVTCTNCFELLKLPKKHISPRKNQQKMKCGACSSIILLELGNKDGFTISISTRLEDEPTEVDEGSSGTADENVRYWLSSANSADMKVYSNDPDDSQLMLSSKDTNPKSDGSEKSGLLSPTSTESDDDDNQSVEKLPSEKQNSPSRIALTDVRNILQANVSDNVVVSRFENGSISRRSERITSRQSSVKDAVVASEMDVSMNEFSNSCVSHESVETNNEDHLRVNNKVSEQKKSFFAGVIKKSFKDFTKSHQSVEEVSGSQVYVNGQFIPDRLVKKAEKMAGPIQPGEYWYDIQAGFWGVMGHPCLGIVMPDIEEFNYPMPEKCAAGNTGIFVNGRELHEKDLDLLSSRGLPNTRHGSYIVDISGKVVDDHTGEELDNLGKLAPTVQKSKHGFGMKVPRFLAQMPR